MNQSNIQNAMRRPVLFLALALILVSCSKDESDLLRVTSPLPEGVLAQDAVFALTFSRGVVPTDSLNKWTELPLIEFTPTIQGKFVWQDTARLVFSPDAPLAGDTKYSGRLNADLLKTLAHARSFSGRSEFEFSTARFTMKEAEFFYDRVGEQRQVGIKANLIFTYAVNPGDVASHITLTVDHQSQSIARVVTTERSKVIAVEVGTVQQLEKEREIGVAFDDQLVSPETNTRIWMERPFVYKLPPLGELTIYGHDAGYDGVQGWIRVRTSQEVDAAAAKGFVSIEPVREYTIQNDGQSFTLRGKFEPGASLRLHIAKGLESVLGGKTRNDYDADIFIGNIPPSFRFASESGLYMLLSGQRTLDIKTININKLNIRVSQVFQNNLVFFLDGGRYYDYEYVGEGDDEGEGSYRRKFRYFLGPYGRQLSFDSVEIKGSVNHEVTTLFSLEPYLHTGYKGFYLVEIANTREPWRSTSKLVSISDIGLIVKRSANEMMVFAASLDNNEPLSGTEIALVSTNNQIIARERTDGDGVVRFADLKNRTKDFPLKLVTAEAENDFNFINLADYEVETSRYDVAGKRDAENVYDAMLYGDRNIYRPGERIYVSGIVRNLTEAVPAQMPVRLKVLNPRGNLVTEQQHALNAEGSFETTMPTQSGSLTGDYRFELYTGNSLFLTSYKVSVEDFVPDRLRITMNASRETAKPGEQIRYDLIALNFFGPPAAGRNWEFEGSLSPIPFKSKAFPTFRFFDDAAKNYSGNPTVVNGRTDDNGKAVVDFALPRELTSTGILRALGRVAVFDESGRPVYQVAQTLVYPKGYFIGILNQGAYYVSPNTPQKMQLVAVDVNDKAIDGFKAKIDIIRYEWHSVLRQFGKDQTLRYVSERREIPVRSDVLTLRATPVEFAYSAPRSGEYAVRVSKEGESGYNQISFYSYDWASTDITSFEVDPEARVEAVLDKAVYTPGDKAHILFQAPFSGKMLVTIERNQVFSYRYLNVVNNAASMDLTIEDKYLPNVYVSAVLFRKIKEMNIPLMAGHGFVPLMVQKKSNKLEVAIKAPEKIRPNTKQTVVVTAGAEQNVFVTLAAVDEGICQVKNYQTPDPYGYFYAKKALQTETYDFFKHLIPEPEKTGAQSSTGGSDADIGRRVNPLGVQRFKPVAIWSGIRKTNSRGEVDVALDVPEFNGELRLMAVAYKGDRFGSAQQAMKVADPVVVTTALPRFLAPGDSIVMPITAFNTTATPVSLTFDVTTAGGISLETRPAVLSIDADQERAVPAALKATMQTGKATVKVRAEAFGERLENVTELPVRPVSPYLADAIVGYVDGGSSASHEVSDAFVPENRRAYLSISTFPVANFAKEMKNLLGYPHGCLEQITSKAFPQIYLRDVAGLLAPSVLNTGSPTYYVNEAISMIASLQTADGGFTYWPGGGYSNDWTTVYATHFLHEARKAGYVVSDALLKPALDAVGRIARSRKTQDYYVYENQKVAVRRIADKSVIYALYVLASAGVPDRAIMDFFRSEQYLLATDTRCLLAGAFALSGDRPAYVGLLPPQFQTEEAVRTSGGWFDSPIRANAIILNVLLETDLNNPNIPRYMEYLSRHYQSHEWWSTQDDAFVLLAFGKAARMAAATNVEGTVTVGKKEYAYKGGTQKLDIDPFGKTVTLAMKGEGRVYYSLVTEGIRTDGAVRMEDRNLQVRREFLDRNGNPVNISTVRQNELIVVRVTLISSVDLLENVAVSDLLPAGFEIENPRLTEMTNYPFIKNASQPEYMDIRDDRINLYTTFRGGKRQQVFYYAVRAVTQGTFRYPAIVAEAMYDGNYYSASGQATVRVVR
jgi:alpha-2-macroglobulin